MLDSQIEDKLFLKAQLRPPQCLKFDLKDDLSMFFSPQFITLKKRRVGGVPRTTSSLLWNCVHMTMVELQLRREDCDFISGAGHFSAVLNIIYISSQVLKDDIEPASYQS